VLLSVHHPFDRVCHPAPHKRRDLVLDLERQQRLARERQLGRGVRERAEQRARRVFQRAAESRLRLQRDGLLHELDDRVDLARRHDRDCLEQVEPTEVALAVCMHARRRDAQQQTRPRRQREH